jgi:SAM-dependent methyltransferase
MSDLNNNAYYESRFVFDKGRLKVWKAINQYLQKFVPNNSSILDIGCGYGDFINGIDGVNKYAIDLNSEMKNYLKDNVIFKAQSVLSSFDIADNSLDIVFASNLFEHFDDDELDILTNEISLKLKKGGKLILIQPNIFYAYKEYWDDYTHKKAFSHVSLNDFLVSKKFKVIHSKKRFLPFSLKSRLPKSFWLTKMYLMSPIKPMGKQMLFVVEKK